MAARSVGKMVVKMAVPKVLRKAVSWEPLKVAPTVVDEAATMVAMKVAWMVHQKGD